LEVKLDESKLFLLFKDDDDDVDDDNCEFANGENEALLEMEEQGTTKAEASEHPIPPPLVVTVVARTTAVAAPCDIFIFYNLIYVSQ